MMLCAGNTSAGAWSRSSHTELSGEVLRMRNTQDSGTVLSLWGQKTTAPGSDQIVEKGTDILEIFMLRI